MNVNNIKRRIMYLMDKYRFIGKVVYPKNIYREDRLNILLNKKKSKLPIFHGLKNNSSKEVKERLEVFEYLSKYYTYDEIVIIWRNVQDKKIKRQNEYKNPNPPPIERKDNQNPVTNTYNYGSGYGNRSSIRVPSKKRKNKMKNFKKLFPNYKF